jgi:hypothetical protein
VRAANLGSQGRAILDVALLSAAYIGFAHFSVANVDLATALPAFLSEREARVGAVFLVGAVAQVLFIAAAAAFLPAMRKAVRATAQRAPGSAWFIALMAAAIQCATVIIFFLPDPSAVVEVSPRHAALLPLPLADGWSQEVVFRGYVILRLCTAGVSVALQIALSALAFASIHVGYVGSEGLGVFWPLVGTATLGGMLAWSVVQGRGSILPATVAHIIILVVVQPWLALST